MIIKNKKTLNKLFLTFLIFVGILSFSTVDAVFFDSDVRLGLTGLTEDIYIASGSECDSIKIEGSKLVILDIPKHKSFVIKDAEGVSLLEVKSDDTEVDIRLFAEDILDGKITKFQTRNLGSVDYLVGVGGKNSDYIVNVNDWYDVDGSPFDSGVNKEIGFSDRGAGSYLTFTVSPIACQEHNFSGNAWSDSVGWISMNCNNNGHWKLVDDEVNDHISTIIWTYTDRTGEDHYETDSFQLEDLPSSGVGNIKNVRIIYYGSGCQRSWLIKDGFGYEPLGASCLIGADIDQPLFTDKVIDGASMDFFGDDWTVDSLNNAQVAIGLSAVDGYPGRLTQIYVRVKDDLGQVFFLRPNGIGKFSEISYPAGDENVGSSIDYGVDFNKDTGVIFGNAWSANIGWISFNSDDLVGCPLGTCEARIDLENGTISGWARALAPIGQPLELTGGWDGWISLNGSTPDYQATIDYDLDPSEVQGYAWGGNNIGWISFNHLNCDPDSDGFSDGIGGCPVAGTIIPDYKVTMDYNHNTPPTATLSVRDTSGDPGLHCGASAPPVFFDWTFVDTDDTQSAYQIQVDNNSDFSSPIVDTGKIMSASGSYAPSGLAFGATYYWRLQVWDSQDVSSGWIDPSPTSFVAPSRWPNPDFTWDPLDPFADQEVEFTNATTNCASCSYSWNFGDGSPVITTADPIHVFDAQNNYSVNLTATSAVGACASSDTVSVSKALPLPTWQEVKPF